LVVAAVVGIQMIAADVVGSSQLLAVEAVGMFALRPAVAAAEMPTMTARMMQPPAACYYY